MMVKAETNLESEENIMAYKCLDCGHIFDQGEESRWVDRWGEVGERMYYINMTGCPLCNGGYEETEQCEICNGEHLREELVGGVCEACVDLYRNNLNVCYNIGEKSKCDVEINGLLACMYSAREIEELILRDLLETQKTRSVDFSPFIENDPDWFAKNLVKEVNKNEC